MKTRKRCPAIRAAASALLVLLVLSACAPGPDAAADAQKTPPPATPAVNVSATAAVPARDAEGYYVVSKNGRFGVVDGCGQTVLPIEFAEAQVLYDDGDPVLFYAVDGTAHAGGQARTGPVGWLYGMDGARLTQENYYSAMMLGGGFVGVWEWDGLGVLTLDGAQIVPCAYQSVTLYGGSIMAAKFESENIWTVDVYSTDGSLQRSGTVENYLYEVNTQWGCYIVTQEESEDGMDPKYGLLDLTFQEIFPVVWDFVQPAGSGTFIVCRDGLYGVVDAQGGEVLPFEYNSIQINIDAFSEGDTVFTASSAEGVTIFDTQWEPVFFAEGYASIRVDDGVIIATDQAEYKHMLDADGQEIAPAALVMYWYDEVQLVVCQQSYDSAPLYYTRDGEQVLLPPCDSSWPVSPNRFIIMTNQSDGSTLYGLCDAKGNIILPVQYSSLSANSLDASGDYHEGGDYLVFSETNEFDTEYSGLMDMDGNVLLPAVFDYVFPEGDLFRVRMIPVYGLMDISGSWVWQASDYEALMD